MATTIEINGKQIDVTDCASASCGNPPIEPRPPRGIRLDGFGSLSPAERELKRQYEADKLAWQKAMAVWMQCASRTCQEAAISAEATGNTVAPVIKTGADAPRPNTTKPPVVGNITSTDNQGKVVAEQGAEKDYTKYIIIGAAVLIAGFIGYKLLKKK